MNAIARKINTTVNKQNQLAQPQVWKNGNVITRYVKIRCVHVMSWRHRSIPMVTNFPVLETKHKHRLHIVTTLKTGHCKHIVQMCLVDLGQHIGRSIGQSWSKVKHQTVMYNHYSVIINHYCEHKYVNLNIKKSMKCFTKVWEGPKQYDCRQCSTVSDKLVVHTIM